MNNRLEQFVRDHREEFDTEEPDNQIWEKIRTDMEPGKKKPTTLVRMQSHWIRWSAAAAVIILIGGAIWRYQSAHKDAAQPAIVQGGKNAGSPDSGTKNPANESNPTHQSNRDNLAQTPGTTNPANPTNPNDPSNLAQTPNPDKSATHPNSDLESSVNEEMYHYAKLVEIKHKELKAIQKDEPLLYKQFSADVYRLDSVYNNLREQLPTNPNREQLLEAMLQNLQLQMGLLNHQLEIIKQINHSKKTEYEKAYKTI